MIIIYENINDVVLTTVPILNDVVLTTVPILKIGRQH